jgi:hypothetical protein
MTSEQLQAYPGVNQQRTLPWLFQLFVLSMIILLVGGGAALLWEAQQTGGVRVAVHAAGDVSVAGSPTLSAATVDAIFARIGSPMVGTGKAVEQASRQTSIDDAFALAVWWTETNDGAAGVGLSDRNPGSVRGSAGYPSAFDGYTIYPSYSAAIVYWFNMLRNNYVNRGMRTVYAIARPYVGTTSYPLWAGKVIALMYKYRGIAPPPPPLPTVVSTPKPKPSVNPSVLYANAVKNARMHKLKSWYQYMTSLNLYLLALDRGQTQETNKPMNAATQPASNPPALPPGAVPAIVLFGLLAAFAIAFYAHKLRIDTPLTTLPGAQPAAPAPLKLPTNEIAPLHRPASEVMPLQLSTNEFASLQLPASEVVPPATFVPVGPKRISPAPAFNLPTRSTASIPRRVTLLRSRTSTDTPGGSLLDRYNNQKNGTYN